MSNVYLTFCVQYKTWVNIFFSYFISSKHGIIFLVFANVHGHTGKDNFIG